MTTMVCFVQMTPPPMNAQSNVTKTKERFYAHLTKTLWDASHNHCVLQDPKTPKGNIVLPIPFAQKSASGMRYNALMGWTHEVAKTQICVLQEKGQAWKSLSRKMPTKMYRFTILLH